MTELQPAHYTQEACHTAQGDRAVLSSFVATEGVRDPASLKVTTGGSGLNVSVATGSAFVDGTQVAEQGMYHVFNNGAVTLTLNAANPTDPRTDLIVVRVYDQTYAGLVSEWHIEKVTGVAGPGAPTPALPANSYALASVLVTAGMTGPIPAGNITDLREQYVLQAGLAMGTSNPLAPIQGERFYRTDLGQEQFWNGTSWVVLSRTPVGAIARRTGAAQSIPDGVSTSLIFDTEIRDSTGSMFTASSSVITVPVAGYYEIRGRAALDTVNNVGITLLQAVTSTGQAAIFERKSNADNDAFASPIFRSGSTEFLLAAGETVSLQLFHTLPAACPTVTGAGYRPQLSVTLMP